MAKTMAQRMSFNNMNTEIENAICIQTSNKETNDINGQCHNGQTESTNDKEVNDFMYIGEDILDESFDF
jgi:hypothetical protein